MKNTLLIAVLAILFFSCSSETIFDDPSQAKPPTPEVFSQDENFNSFMEIVHNIANQEINRKKLKRALDSKDYEAISMHLGFKSLDEAMEVNTKMREIFTNLDNSYKISELTEIERNELIRNAIDFRLGRNMHMKSCESEKQICFNTAIKDFAVAAGGCGVATAGAALAGPIAAGFTALICLGTATYVLDIDRDNCNIKYDCKLT